MRIMVENISDQQQEKELQSDYKTKINVYLTKLNFATLHAVSIRTSIFSILEL
jgi:hypothetical protein